MTNEVNNYPETRSDNLIKLGIVFLVALGFLSTFVAGVYLGKIVPGDSTHTTSSTPKPLSSITPSPNLTVTNTSTKFLSENDHTKQLPGKHFFRDTLMIVTKAEPHYTLAATVTRSEDGVDYYQNTAASFFNGNSWARIKANRRNIDPRIESDEIIQKWSSTIDPARVLKQKISADIYIDNTPVSIETDILENEISMRSLPGYTKFMSQGKAVVTINGVKHESYVLLTRIYSLNSENIQFYTEPIGLTTDWLAFWELCGLRQHY